MFGLLPYCGAARLMALGLAGVCLSSVNALTVSATLIPEPGPFAVPVGSRRKAGGGGRFSKLPTGVKGRFVFVIDDVRLIGGGGLLVWTELRRNRVFRIVPEYSAKKLSTH